VGAAVSGLHELQAVLLGRAGRRAAGPADAGPGERCPGGERVDEPRQVLAVPHVVGRQVGDERCGRGVEPGVESGSQSAVGVVPAQPDPGVVGHGAERVVGRAVVDDHRLPVEQVLRQQAAERPAKPRRLVVDRDDDGDARAHPPCAATYTACTRSASAGQA
jgi:hypothetical protein